MATLNKFDTHPTVIKLRSIAAKQEIILPLDKQMLKNLALACGADDVGFVALNSALLDEQRADILKSFPNAKSIISIVCKTNQFAIRAPQRSIANSEFHHAGKNVDDAGRELAKKLMAINVGAMNEPMAFPMEYADFPGKSWIVSHKQVAVAAGMGQMGLHRNVIHPKFGNFILLGSVVIDREIADLQTAVLDYNPCIDCKLCFAACPVGAISPNGHFNFSACLTHNYREFMGGFIDWVDAVTTSKNAADYKEKFNDGETVSMWQSLSYGANYKAAYCVAVCPAVEDVISPFLHHKKEFLKEVLNPLQEKVETIYAVKGTDAVEHVHKRFPHKTIKFVRNGLSVKSIDTFLFASHLIFQPDQSKGIDAIYHFVFTGKESLNATLIIKNQQLIVHKQHVGKANLVISAKSQDWVRFLNGQLNLFLALATRKIKLKGPIKYLQAFGKCLPRN